MSQGLGLLGGKLEAAADRLGGGKVDEEGEDWPIYKGSETELTKSSDQRVALIKDYAANFMTMTDAKAKELGETAMGIEKQRMKLEHDCFEKIASEISPLIEKP